MMCASTAAHDMPLSLLNTCVLHEAPEKAATCSAQCLRRRLCMRCAMPEHSPRALGVLRPLRLLLANLAPGHFQEFPAKVQLLQGHLPPQPTFVMLPDSPKPPDGWASCIRLLRREAGLASSSAPLF